MAINPRLDWQVLLDENEWDTGEEMAQREVQSSSATVGTRSSYRLWIAGLLLGLLAAGVGLRLWMQAQIGLAAVETGLSHSLVAEHRAADESDGFLATALLDPEAELSWRIWLLGEQRQPWERTLEVEIVDFVLVGDRAMAQVRLTDPESGAVYRENRFYRETPHGWLRSQPAFELWGETRSLESDYFVFTYRQLDDPAVVEAASLLDRAYVHLHAGLGQTLPVAARPEEKVTIRVVMSGGSNTPWYTTGEPLTVNSPQLMRLPEGVTDGQALAEAVTLALHREVEVRSERQSYQPALEFLGGATFPMGTQARRWIGSPTADSHSAVRAAAIVPSEEAVPVTRLTTAYPHAPLEYWEEKFFVEEVLGQEYTRTPRQFWEDKFFEQEVGEQ
ncbi:MAG TPA: hypothetical protein PL105_04595 [Caldilineaceae bacterium]|nr:hypothetical protein [Caldilineaceae bacterium]